MRLTAVSYLNAKPFIYGLYRSNLAGSIDLSLDIPSVCAQKLLKGEVDLALMPVAAIPQLPKAFIVSEYCIGAEGAVKTVCLYSEVPLNQIQIIYLDFHSRTSAALVQILCRRYWHIEPQFLPASEGFEQQIKGRAAGLVIGDRTIGMQGQFAYSYDLGTAWTTWTGLPFVFAAWTSTRPIQPEFLRLFDQALQLGLNHLPELLKILPAIPNFDMEKYFCENISYRLDEAKWNALQYFLSFLTDEKGYQLIRI